MNSLRTQNHTDMFRGILALTVLSFTGSTACGEDPQEDPHQHWRQARPFDGRTVTNAAKGIRYAATSDVPPEANDVLNYFTAQGDPGSGVDRPIILGRVIILKPGVRLKDTGDSLAPGEYIHWLGRSAGEWIGGYTTVDGKSTHACQVLFKPFTDDHHKHITVWSHTPDDATVLRAAVALPGGGTIGIPPRPPPPRPRCIEVWRTWTIPGTTDTFCSKAGWMVVNN